jgi:V/A-type H+-transporting ATPase subunit D
MRLAVNATRMELLRLRRRLAVALRGHKLLKDKQEELLRQFQRLVEENRQRRREVEERLGEAYQFLLFARGEMGICQVQEAVSLPSQRLELKVGITRILNVEVPQIDWQVEGTPFSYSFANTVSDLDIGLQKLGELLPELIKLAQGEESIRRLAVEIERTRRRVNALEYIFIPNLKETIKYVTMKLSEIERSNVIRLMRIKELVRSR